MKLNKDVREEIELKYQDGTSDEILRHLKRNFQIYTTQGGLFSEPVVFLNIEGKSYTVQNSKKYIKQKIHYIIKDQFEHFEESVRMKTIKKFLDMVISLDPS